MPKGIAMNELHGLRSPTDARSETSPFRAFQRHRQRGQRLLLGVEGVAQTVVASEGFNSVLLGSFVSS
jgi:hypothetical protein